MAIAQILLNLKLSSVNLITLGALIILSTVPLQIAVTIMGGTVTWKRSFIVNILAAAVPFLISLFFQSYIALISFLVIILIYMYGFLIPPVKAFFTWLLQYAFVFGIYFLFVYNGIVV